MRSGSHGTGRRVSIVAAMLLAVLVAVSALAEDLEPDTSRPTKIGVFLNSVFDINPGRDSYVADISYGSAPERSLHSLCAVHSEFRNGLAPLEPFDHIQHEI